MCTMNTQVPAYPMPAMPTAAAFGGHANSGHTYPMQSNGGFGVDGAGQQVNRGPPSHDHMEYHSLAPSSSANQAGPFSGNPRIL